MPHAPLTTTQHAEQKQVILAELVAARAEYQRLLGSLSDADWRRRSSNPGWTNGEILFHMALGFFLLPTLLPMIRLLGRLPKGATRPFAALLNLATGPFNWVNALGPRLGARLFRRRSLGKTYDWVMRRVLRTVRTVHDDEWQRGMHYPTNWDALFRDYMTLEHLLRYPIAHMRFHADQLSVSASHPTAQPAVAPVVR
jgi:DinB superfamily